MKKLLVFIAFFSLWIVQGEAQELGRYAQELEKPYVQERVWRYCYEKHFGSDAANRWEKINDSYGMFQAQREYMELSIAGTKSEIPLEKAGQFALDIMRLLYGNDFHLYLKQALGAKFPLRDEFLSGEGRAKLLEYLYKASFPDGEALRKKAQENQEEEAYLAKALLGDASKKPLECLKFLHGDSGYLVQAAKIFSDQVSGMYLKALDEEISLRKVLEHLYVAFYGQKRWESSWALADRRPGKSKLRLFYLALKLGIPRDASFKKLTVKCLQKIRENDASGTLEETLDAILGEEVAPLFYWMRKVEDVGQVYMVPILMAKVKDKAKLEGLLSELLAKNSPEWKNMREKGYFPLQFAPTRLSFEKSSARERRWSEVLQPKVPAKQPEWFQDILFDIDEEGKPRLANRFYIQEKSGYWVYFDQGKFCITANKDGADVYAFQDYHAVKQLFPRLKGSNWIWNFGKPYDAANRVVFHIPGNISREIDSESNTIFYPDAPIFSEVIVHLSPYHDRLQKLPENQTGGPQGSLFLLRITRPEQRLALRDFFELDKSVHIQLHPLAPQKFERLCSIARIPKARASWSNPYGTWVLQVSEEFLQDWTAKDADKAPVPYLYKATRGIRNYLNQGRRN